MELYRHGDVILRESVIPEGASEVYKGRQFVAQEGETTGHKHLVKGPEFTVHLLNGTRYFDFPEPATITHEEHKKLVIRPGKYVQIQEREVDWFTHTTRQVID